MYRSAQQQHFIELTCILNLRTIEQTCLKINAMFKEQSNPDNHKICKYTRIQQTVRVSR